MERKAFTIQDVGGNAIRGASVLIKTYPGGVTATLYADDEVTPITNPMTTDSTGQCFGKAANGHYTQVVSKTGITTETETDIVFFDPDDLTDQYAAPTGSSLVGHIASGASAVLTTVKAKLQERVSSFDFMTDAQRADVLAGTASLDCRAAIVAATATGKVVDGCGLTYGVTGNLEPHASFVGMINMTLKQLTPTGSNRRTLLISGRTGFYLHRVYVNRNGNLSGGVLGDDAGIWITGCSKFAVGEIGSTGGGAGNGVTFQSCFDFYDMAVTVHDERYTTVSVPADDVVNGIWYNNCYNFISYNPYVYDCGCLVSAVVSKRRSRGIAFSGCYNFEQHSPRCVNVDQGHDITGTVGNHDFSIIGGIITGCYSYSYKSANSTRRGTYENCKGDGAAINFITSGPTEVSNPLPRDITYKRCISIDADKNGGSATGISAAGFRIQSVGAIDATYPRGVIYDNCQAIDTQGSPTMLIGFDNDVSTGTAQADINRLINGCKASGFVTSATNGFTEDNCITGIYRRDGTAVRDVLFETDAPANEKMWDTVLVAGDMSRRTRTDADGTGEVFELIQRTAGVVDLIRHNATAMRHGGVSDSARYHEFDNNGRIIQIYSDNSAQLVKTQRNFGIAASGQGIVEKGTFGTGGASGADAWKISYLSTDTWAAAGNRDAKIKYEVALNGSLVTALEILPTGCIMLGTTTNDSAASTMVGEFITATVAVGSAVSLTNATGANVTSISLTAGDWDVSAQNDFVLTGATSTSHQSGISLTSATLPSQAGGSGLGTDALAVLPMPTTGLSGTLTQPIPPVRINLAATTTVYLVAQAAFSVGSESAYGTIRARRPR